MPPKSRPSAASARPRVPTPPIKFADEKQVISKKSGHAAPRKKGGSSTFVFSFGLRVALFYTIFAALWHCPSRPLAFDYSTKDPRPVCRNIAQAHQQLAPLVTSYIQKAQAKIDPYTKPTIDAVSPYVNKAWKVSRPYYIQAQKRGKIIYKKNIDPARKRAVKKAKAQIDPYVKKANAQYNLHVQPHLDTANRAIKPYQDIYRRDVSPYVRKAYQYSLQSSSVSYSFYMDKVHPHVVELLKHVQSFLVNHVSPALRRFYSLYIRPQGEKLLAKVYERKAHYLGSDAIKAARKESKQAGKDTDAHATESVKEAVRSAVKAQEDPSLLDKVKQAKDSVGSDEDPVKVAQLDAELDAEEAKVTEKLGVWESGMTSLIEKEHKLAIDRFIELRNRYMADLPDRFGLVSEAFIEDKVAVILTRIERGLKKLSPPANNSPLAGRLTKGQDLVSQQLEKLDEAAESTKVQIARFYEELLSQERQSVEMSYEEVRRYGLAAKTDFDKVMKEAKFSETFDEWAGWDKGVLKRANMFLEELSAVQKGEKKVEPSSGAADLPKESPNVGKEIENLRSFSIRLHTAARREVEKFGESGLSQLRGDGVIAKLSDVVDSIADQATSISLEAASGMLGLVGAARSKLGLGEPVEDTSYFGRARAYAAQVSRDLSNSAAAASSVSSAGASVANEAASAAGGMPKPESLNEHAEQIIANVQDKAAEAISSASSLAAPVVSSAFSIAASNEYVDAATEVVHSATRSVQSALGATPSPKGIKEHVEQAAQKVKEAAERVRDEL